ncbi:MAG: type II secretion system protein N [Pseudomonadota bacterium]
MANIAFIQGLPERLPGLASTLAIAAAFAVAAWGVAKIVWIGVAGPTLPNASDAPTIASRAATIDTDFSVLERLSPFNTDVAPPAELVESSTSANPGEDLPETELELSTSGRIGATALISVGGGPDQRYAAGDSIDGLRGVEVAELAIGGVVLSRDGQKEWLPVTKGENGIVTLGGEPSPEASLAVSGASSTEPSDTASEAPISAENARATISRDDLFDLLAGIDATADGAGVVIYPQRSADRFAAAGLRGGDRLVSIQNRRVANPEDLYELADTLETVKRVELELERDGNALNLTILVDD